MAIFKHMTEKQRNRYLLTVELLLVLLLSAGLFFGISVVRKDAYLDTLHWPDTDFLPGFSNAAPVLDCLLTGGMDTEEAVLAASLQSVVNKTQPRIYLSEEDPASDTAAYALSLKFNTPTDDIYALLDTYIDDFDGLVIWDPALVDTAHLAAVIGTDKRCLVVNGQQAADLSERYGLPVVEDLRGRFTHRLQVYEAMLEDYGDKTSTRLLVGCDPTDSTTLWDYAATVGSLRVWLNPGDPEEAALLEKFLQRMPAGKSVYLGDWPDDNAGVELASRYGVTSLSGTGNLSVYAAVSSLPTDEDGAEAEEDMPRTVLEPENCLYIALVTGSGTLEENLRRLPAVWEDVRESRLPMNWSLSPALPHMAPALLDALEDTASGLDCWINPTAGFGTFDPAVWQDGEGLLQFLKRADGYADSLSYPAFTLPAGWTEAISTWGAEGLMTLYAENMPHLQALLDPDAAETSYAEQLLRLPLHTVQSAEELEALCQQLTANYAGDGPAFAVIQTPLLDFSAYEAAVAQAQQAGKEVRFVTLSDMAALARGQYEDANASTIVDNTERTAFVHDWAPYDLSGVEIRSAGPSPWRYVGAGVVSLLGISAALLQFFLLEKARKRRGAP